MSGQIGRGLSAGGRAHGYRGEPGYNAIRHVIGYRRAIDPGEAAVIRRIFDLYESGLSPKGIVHLLNAEHVPPPRPTRVRELKGWTWTTIHGCRKKAIGILNPA